jgi:Flp pilus assembly protein TadG
MMRHAGRRGSALLEFTLVGIPMIFASISIVQMAIGMWNYATLQYAVRQAAAFASVHGAHCQQTPNSCLAYLSDTAKVLEYAGIGLPPSHVTVTFTAWKTKADAEANTNASTVTCQLDNCISQTNYKTMQWPPNQYNNEGASEIAIGASYTWHSGMAMVGPSPTHSNSYTLPAYSHQPVMF